MVEFRWVVSIILGLVSLLGITGNLAIVITYYVKGRTGSLVPLVGGMAGCLALLISPIPGAGKWFWIPPVLDIGCGYMIGAVLVLFVRHAWKKWA